MPEFKDMLKYFRIREHLSQSELAEKLGIAPSTISMYEVGKREPDFETEEKIADFFNTDLNTLRGRDSEQKEKPPQIIGYYNSLNSTGQKEATKRVKELTYLPEYTLKVNQNEPEHLMPNAAHADDYDSAPDELKQLEENIMDDDDF